MDTIRDNEKQCFHYAISLTLSKQNNRPKSVETIEIGVYPDFMAWTPCNIDEKLDG